MFGESACNSDYTFLSFSSFLPTNKRFNPFYARSIANCFPIPSEAPELIIFFIKCLPVIIVQVSLVIL